MQGQKVRPSLYAGIVCENSSLAPPSGTPRASSPTIIIAAGDNFIPHPSLPNRGYFNFSVDKCKLF